MIYLVTNQRPSTDVFPIASVEESLDYCNDLTEVCLDIESTGLNFIDDKIIFLILGDRFNQYVIDSTIDYTLYKSLIESKLIIGHNLKFDYKFLKQFDINIKRLYDTYIAERLIQQGYLRTGNVKKEFLSNFKSTSLQETVKRHLNKDLVKTTRASFIGMNILNYNVAQISYAAHDILYLNQIKEIQTNILTDRKELNVLSLENRVVIPLAEMEYEGMSINIIEWNKIYEENNAVLLEIEKKLNNEVLTNPKLQKFIPTSTQTDLFNDNLNIININWSSPAQCLKIFKKLIPSLESTDSNILEKHSKIELVSLFLKYKEYGKLITTYGKDFLKHIWGDGRVHSDFNQIINTGRMSNSNPNLQQIPADNKYRNCFVSNYKDWVYVSSDFSSQELCVLAHDSQDKVWHDALIKGQDLHSICGELIFNDEWKDAAESNCSYYINKSKCKCKKHKELRTITKTIAFGLSYGMGADKLSNRLDIPLDYASSLINKFFNAFPAIKQSLDKSSEFGTKFKYIRTLPPFNRIRWFGDEKDFGNIQRESKNTKIQGSSADMTKLALVYVWDYIQKNNLPVKLVCTVHDQIDTICHKDYAIKWNEELTMLMEQAAKVIIPSGLLKAETTISNNWNK